jgi:hypothetical protein
MSGPTGKGARRTLSTCTKPPRTVPRRGGASGGARSSRSSRDFLQKFMLQQDFVALLFDYLKVKHLLELCKYLSHVPRDSRHRRDRLRYVNYLPGLINKYPGNHNILITLTIIIRRFTTNFTNCTAINADS